jgi:hypothetical protein
MEHECNQFTRPPHTFLSTDSFMRHVQNVITLRQPHLHLLLFVKIIRNQHKRPHSTPHRLLHPLLQISIRILLTLLMLIERVCEPFDGFGDEIEWDLVFDFAEVESIARKLR